MRTEDRDIWREAIRATSLGWDLALPIFAGVLIGYLLDRALGTTYVFTLGLLVLGVATGFYNVVRSIRRMDERCRRRAAGRGRIERDEGTEIP
ncbi:MAG: AtpZ/AtpI family protein [Anaerolineae bacterium]|jgi:ATP synthase protein I